MSNRYLEPVRAALTRRHCGEPGLAMAIAPATQQALVAEAVAEVCGAAVTVLPADIPGLDALPAKVVATLPRDPTEARQSLEALNSARTRVTLPGRLLIVVVDRGEHLELQRLAGDARSVLRFTIVVSFVPDDGVDEGDARRALSSGQRQRFGKLDLRGFIRAHTEDVAWSVEALYQELCATEWTDEARLRGLPALQDGGPLREHLENIFAAAHGPASDEGARDAAAQNAAAQNAAAQNLAAQNAAAQHTAPQNAALPAAAAASAPTAILLGHPGAGKTFFLRWLALHAAESDTLFGMDQPLPVLVPLSAFARAPRPITLDEHIVEILLQEGQPAAHVFDAAARAGRVLFLLDGLDEVGDEPVRRSVAEAMRELAARFPRCPIVATSRLSGYTEAPLGGRHLVLSPLGDDAIRRFLVTWSELYARELHGPAAAERGRREGESLARDVLDNPAITALARNPLMLTVLAIVHRAGVRLPDHRVELYSHASEILVERWNQVRSLASVGGAVPIKAADAARLLGPVALAVMRSEARGAVPEDMLRQHLARAIESGHLRALTSADEALELFQRSLGLLVEQAPGMYAFLHLTLAEYLAAWELVRTGELETLAANPREAFRSRWRETLLLVAAVLGVLRAEDQRLTELVRLLIDGAGRRKGKPSPGVPSLLAGFLADDPDLSQDSVEALLDSLIPTWWFERKYGSDSIEGVFREAFELINRRLNRGRHKQAVRERLMRHFGAGLSPAMQENLARDQSPRLDWLTELRIVLVAADVDESGIFFQLCSGAAALPRWLPWPLIALQEGADPGQPGAFLIGRGMARAARDGALRLDIRTSHSSMACRPDWERQGDVDDKEGYVHVPFVLEDTGAPVPPEAARWVYVQDAEILDPLAAT
jgi:hypothetical protein